MNIHILLFILVNLYGERYLINCHPCNDDLVDVNSNDIHNKNEPRIFSDPLADFIMNSDWLPIEINVPDTISSAVTGINGMWTSLNEYYQSWSENSSTPRRRRNSTKIKKYKYKSKTNRKNHKIVV